MTANPRLVVVRIPPAGSDRRLDALLGFGAQFDGLTGLGGLAGHHDTRWWNAVDEHMDSATGVGGGVRRPVGAALPRATGRGQLIELAQMENVLAHLGDEYVGLQLGVEPERLGNRDPRVGPRRVSSRCGRGPLAGHHRHRRRRVARADGVLGRAELAGDERWPASRPDAAHAELDDMVRAWAGRRHRGVPRAAGGGRGGGAARRRRHARRRPQLPAREWIRPLGAATSAPTRTSGTFPRRPAGVGPRRTVLGEDNEYVFKKVLRLDDETYGASRRSGSRERLPRRQPRPILKRREKEQPWQAR